MIGYTKSLFILPFDHRTSLISLFGFTNPQLNSSEKGRIVEAKELIFSAFIRAIEQGIPKDEVAILIDEEYGDKIIKNAISEKYNVILTTEKSGQKEFVFEYGDDFAKHVEKYKPGLVKALINYNPNDDPLSKMRQQQKMQTLSNYCHSKSYKFLLELLVPATPQQLSETSGNKELYDSEMRPNLTVKAIEELQNANVEPDVWKIEGMEREDSYKIVAMQVRKNGRDDVGIVILGRAENKEKVEKWINVGKKIKGVIGFAVGRTVFWDTLVDYKNGRIDSEKAINSICNNFLYFYNLFKSK